MYVDVDVIDATSRINSAKDTTFVCRACQSAIKNTSYFSMQIVKCQRYTGLQIN